MAGLYETKANADKEESRIAKQRGKEFVIDNKKIKGGTQRYLKDGTKVNFIKAFGNPTNPQITVVFPDERGRKTISASLLAENKDRTGFKGKAGAPSTQLKDTSITEKRPENKFNTQRKTNSNLIDKAFKNGLISTDNPRADLRKLSFYTNASRGQRAEMHTSLAGILGKQGLKVENRPKKEKIVAPSKYDKKGNLLKTAFTESINKLSKGLKSGSVKMGGGGGFPIQIQEPLLLDTKQMNLDRRSGMSQRRFIQKYPGQKYASGGMVNAKLGAFVEVQNNFSDRMLPNKKRTTRIY